jgi:hypothetical protein
MNNQAQAAVQLTETEIQNSAENAPKWHCSPSEPIGNPSIVEVMFGQSNARKRESLNKPPRRVKNAERRSREFLTEAEIEKLVSAAEKQGRHGHRDATMLLVGFRHGLREFAVHLLRRAKRTTHPVQRPQDHGQGW